MRRQSATAPKKKGQPVKAAHPDALTSAQLAALDAWIVKGLLSRLEAIRRLSSRPQDRSHSSRELKSGYPRHRALEIEELRVTSSSPVLARCFFERATISEHERATLRSTSPRSLDELASTRTVYSRYALVIIILFLGPAMRFFLITSRGIGRIFSFSWRFILKDSSAPTTKTRRSFGGC
jgi:hypothetical protein